MVLQIFYQHARSREARLQVALAEIPYLKNRLMIDHEYERGNKHSGSRLGEQYYDTQKFILKKLEASIREVHGMFIDINTLIQSQGEMVTRIEDYVNSKLDESSIKLLITRM